MVNFYFQLALRVLSDIKEPLSARDILDVAKARDLIPHKYLSAKTPHRTIHARIAESIRHERDQSPFYRYARGRYSVKSHLEDPDYPALYKREYKSAIRRKEISREYVLCIPRRYLGVDDVDGFIADERVISDVLSSRYLIYLPRRLAEEDFTHKQIITYVAVIKDGCVLCYQRGAYSAAADELVGLKSIGFGGHVSEQNRNLFDSDDAGVAISASRELFEELKLQTVSDPVAIGMINDNSTIEGRKHIAVAMLYHCHPDQDPTSGELEISNLHWIRYGTIPNNFTSYEIWSQRFLNHLAETWKNNRACR